MCLFYFIFNQSNIKYNNDFIFYCIGTNRLLLLISDVRLIIIKYLIFFFLLMYHLKNLVYGKFVKTLIKMNEFF
jgi:hypothetical protein